MSVVTIQQIAQSTQFGYIFDGKGDSERKSALQRMTLFPIGNG